MTAADHVPVHSDIAIGGALVFHERAGGLLVVLSPDLLKAACAARGWSLTQLAARAGISRPTLRSVLKGCPVRPRTMWKLANALSRAPVPTDLAQILRVS